MSVETVRLRDLTVIENDHGIRPAGRPDACFYCEQHIGQQHKPDCAVVVKLVELRVLFKGFDGSVTFQTTVPHFWEEATIEFQFGDAGSWCSDNLFGYVANQGTEADMTTLRRAHRALVTTEGGCLCGKTTIVLDRVVDEGPYIEKREPEEDEP